MTSLRARATRALAVTAVAALALAVLPPAAEATVPTLAPTANPDPPVPVVIAVGDIACDPNQAVFKDGVGNSAGCRQQAVGDAVRAAAPDVFIPLGDNQYFDGRLAAYRQSYDPAFGWALPITRPIPGNHEYKTARGAGYYAYFGDSAHEESRGTYSYDVGSWHVLAINSTQCGPRQDCGPGSDMAKWIASDLAESLSPCVMAVWHHPVWSAGIHGDYKPMVPVWNQLYDAGVDLVLNGHDHLYQRSRPLGRATVTDGALDPPTPADGGMVEFVVGTGGEDNYSAPNLVKPQLADAMAAVGTNPNPAVFGALRVAMRPDGYDFDFVPARGTTFADTGSSGCRTKTPPTGTPVRVDTVAVNRAGDGTVQVSWPQAAPGAPTASNRVSVSGSGRSCSTNGNACTITGLGNGRSYQFRVASENAVGRTIGSQTPPYLVAMRPARPAKPTVQVNGTSVTAEWAAPDYDGGAAITGYTAATTTGGAACVTGGARTCTVTGLTPGKEYTLVVTASNLAGVSVSSQGATLRIPAAAAIGQRPAVPAVASATRAGDGAVDIAVAAGAQRTPAVTGITVYAPPSARTCTVVPPATSCRITGLTNGSAYSFKATAVSSAGSSDSSPLTAPLVVGRVAERATAVTMTPLSRGQALVSWTAPRWNGGLAITGYEIRSTNGLATCRSTTTSCLVTGLVAGKAYSFAVVAVNDAGPSLPSVGSPFGISL
jgi:acid phosphatase type 7